ncbi:MAG: hypothetical protein A3F74_27705 [Betaproteobacteria bacterium RIFCSPLOWO2_12_FULL_62_58]|nr:MAG: hypothetical protein A3F74_27705 [Betaproteobacteria bacterium RIFCSPLOWO2_12_FULL_62_58]
MMILGQPCKHVYNIDNLSRVGQTTFVKRFYVEFGRSVRRQRERDDLGLSQEALAKRVGLSRTSITNIEKGRQQIPLHALYTFADALGVDPTSLLPDKKSLTAERKRVTIDLNELPEDLAEFVDRIASKES